MSRTHMPASVGRELHGRRTKAGKRFMVRAITKAGTITRMAITASDWQLNAFHDLEQAHQRAAALETMNPGKRFAIVPITNGIVGTQSITR